MFYTAIDTFYLTDEQLKDSPSRKDGIDEETETSLRIYGCDLIQESGILLKLPQAVMATGQVLFHRFYCKRSFGRFDVKRVAASCLWLASKLEESPRKARQILIVFHRMECRRENLPIEHLDLNKKYTELKVDLIRTERHLLKEMGFICHVEHPHKFISNYLATLGTPPELRQEAWNLANDSLRTTLCVRFKSEVVACGVVYAAARRFQVPLPENPPWWKAFDADKSGIDEVCLVLADLYSRPKAKYIPVCKEAVSFATSHKSWDSQSQLGAKELNTPDTNTPVVSSAATSVEGSKDAVKQGLDQLKEPKKSDDYSKNIPSEGEGREESVSKSRLENRTDSGVEKNRDRDTDRERERDGRDKDGGYTDRDRGREVRDKDRERDRQKSRDRERKRNDREQERDDTNKERSHRSRDKYKDSGGHSDKSRRHSSRDRERDQYYSSREKDRHRHHSYV